MSEEHMNDSTFSRWFILMILMMCALTVFIVVLASQAAGDVNSKLDEQKTVENKAALAKRLEPVGKFAVGTSAGETLEETVEEPVILSGEQAYASCVACHGAGVAGAPALGDAANWSARIEQGIEVLYDHAINGYQGSAGFMPAKGGNTSLSDESVKAAVDYMIANSK